jgi:methylated-DNA-[protein]-cysteine S-methyltransferase
MNVLNGTQLVHTIVASPIGPLAVVADAEDGAIVAGRPQGAIVDGRPKDAIVAVRFPNAPLRDGEGGRRDDNHPLLRQAAEQLTEYFAGERTEFDVPLAPAGTPFQLAAWTALRSIPYGDTVSYGEQARRLGDPNKSRAVGAANGRNPIPIVVPCHRVVGANGHLTGFGGGIEAKAWLLDHEQRVRLAL